MNFLRLIIINILAIALLVGCGDKGKTQAKLNVTVGKLASPELATYVGGAILIGSSQNNGSFAINLLDAPDGVSLTLQNDQWSFYGFIWDGIGDSNGNPTMEGVVRCAQASAQLDGGEVSIALSFSNVNCDNELLAPQRNFDGTNFRFPYFTLESCSEVSGITAATDFCGLRTPGMERGYFGSYRVVMETYDESGAVPVTGAPLFSDCYDSTTSASTGVAMGADSPLLNIPFGNGSFPLRFSIEAFDDNACAGNRAFSSRVFNNGLFIPDGSSVQGVKSYTHMTSPNIETKLFHNTPRGLFCSQSFPLITEFSGGDGLNVPYAICEPWQWELIGDITTDVNYTFGANYALMRDISFQGREALVGVDPPNCDKLPMPSNFVPVGYNCTSGAMGNAFTGTFYGYGNWISNPIFFDDNLNQVGLFSSLATPGNIYDLNINNANIEGASLTGTLVGDHVGGNIENIRVLEADVRSHTDAGVGSKTGGVIGGSTAGNINQIIAERVSVGGNNNGIGGIIGSRAGGDMSKLYFNGRVSADQKEDNSNSAFVGGIVGEISGAIIISEAASKGSIYANSTYVGGIVGYHARGTATITDSYSQMSLVSYLFGSSIRLGGILGASTNVVIVTDSYFSGTIKHYCNDGTQTNCLVGGLAGSGAGGLGATYSTESLATTFGGQDAIGPVADSYTTGGFVDLLNPTEFPVTSFSTNGDSVWDVADKRYPRLDWELAAIQNPCNNLPLNYDSFANQQLAGRGSIDNPFRVCTSHQFTEIKDFPSSHFVLKDHINLKFVHMNNDGSVINNFSGSLDGEGRVIHGGQIKSSVDAPLGLIRTITSEGIVENFFVNNLQVTRTTNVTNGGMGIIAGSNNGLIEKVYANFSDIDGSAGVSAIGGIAGMNSGSIVNVHSSVEILGSDQIGGIAGFSNGTISGAQSDLRLFASAGSFTNVGGVVGETSDAIVDKSSWGGEFNIVQGVSSAMNIGGIVGHATNGTVISNTNTDNQSIIVVMNGANVGGLVGLLAGNGVDSIDGSVISNSYNAAEIRYGYCSGGVPSASGNELSKYECLNRTTAGNWNLPGDTAVYGSIAGSVIEGSNVGTKVFYVNPPYNILQIGETPNTTSNPGGVTCQIDTGTALTAPLSGTLTLFTGGNRGIFLGNHNKYFDITSEVTVNQVINVDFDIGNSAQVTDCTDLTADSYWDNNGAVQFDIVEKSTNTIGTKVFDLEMVSMQTFCDDTLPAGNEYFQCSSGWDIVEDNVDTNGGTIPGDLGDGFSRLLDVYYAYLFNEPEPVAPPIWQLETEKRDRYPRLINVY